MSVPEGLQAALADRYLVEGEIGSGGMATVYLARDVRHNRRVVLEWHAYDIFPDGSEFIIWDVASGASQTLSAIVNWPEDLRRRF